jgi:hypothetical protein
MLADSSARSHFDQGSQEIYRRPCFIGDLKYHSQLPDSLSFFIFGFFKQKILLRQSKGKLMNNGKLISYLIYFLMLIGFLRAKNKYD